MAKSARHINLPPLALSSAVRVARDCRSASCSERVSYWWGERGRGLRGRGGGGGEEREKSGRGACLLDDLRAFGTNANQWTTAEPRTRENTQDGGTRGGIFLGEMDRCRDSQGWTRAYSSSIIVCPDVTGRSKERFDQSKRDRAGSLALVD